MIENDVQSISRYKVPILAKLLLFLVLGGFFLIGLITPFLRNGSEEFHAPTAGSIFFGLIWVVISLGLFVLLYNFLEKPLANVRRLQTIGIPTTAELRENAYIVKKVKFLGADAYKSAGIFAGWRKVHLLLELKNRIGHPYTAKSWILIDRTIGFGSQGLELIALNAGTVIPVRVDPSNENNVVIDIEKFR